MASRPPPQKPASASTLDTLMMAYSDLSAPSKASTFKGPAVKDIRVERTNARTFQQSQKARDWTSLAQNLEDAFATGSSPAAAPPPAAAPLFPSQPFQSLPPMQQQPQPLPTQPAGFDDFGDFAAAPPPPPPKEPKSLESAVLPAAMKTGATGAEPDDFADFVSARPTISAAPMPVSAPAPPAATAVSKPADDDFGDFSGNSAAPIPDFATFTKTPGFGLGSDSSNPPLPPASNKAAPKPNITTNFNFDVLQSQPAVSNPAVFASPTPPVNPPAATTNPVPSVPAAQSRQGLPGPQGTSPLKPVIKADPGDKYGALRDIFGGTDSANDEPATATATQVQPSKVEEDDFGDFAAASNETSGGFGTFPSASTATTASSINAVFMPQQNVNNPTASSSIIPWISNSPPPPPDDIAEDKPSFVDDLDGVVPQPDNASVDPSAPSASLAGMSSLATFDNDDFYSQIDELSVSNQQQQHQETKNVLDLPPELHLSATSSRKASDDSLQDRYRDLYELSSSSSSATPSDVWLKAVREIRKLLADAAESFQQIADDREVLLEVVESGRGADYLTNLREIYAVFKRICLSCNERDNDEEEAPLKEAIEDVEKSWAAVKNVVSAVKDLTASNTPIGDSDSPHMGKCGICLRSLKSGFEGGSNSATLSHGAGKYHSACANFWVNRVEIALPALS